MTKDITSELMQLKRRIEETKAEKNRVEGELRQLSKAMKDEFGTDDPKKIQEKVDGLKRQADALRAQVDKELAALKQELGDE